ncbi:unnamed protein product [Phytophthora lilii]|uniref:Unnamed protein product n=1 Tax=Phytophthora lilii TaxID=2077276 RepID=A0A9W6YER1_9STRA|nr:unnamed protein product [Phytophthora lilii]
MNGGCRYAHDGMPHKTKIPQKPEGIGAESKSIGDGDSGILLGLDLVKVFGMVVVVEYKAYKYESIESGSLDSAIVDFNDFMSQLAYQLIFNEIK